MGRFFGVLPPVTTPFGADGGLALERLGANLTAWHETGLSGYLLLGSNAEAVSLTEEEKLRVLETARAHIPRDRLLLAGTGLEGTAATVALTKAAARELAHWGILVNAVAPGLIDTDMTAAMPAEAREGLLAQVPLKRIGLAQEVAEVVRFLARDGASYVTGQVIHVDGGLSM